MAVTISVVIPVYNSERYLRQCLGHLRRSTLADYECIVVDDGSTDSSADVAAQHGVTVLRTDRRRGPARSPRERPQKLPSRVIAGRWSRSPDGPQNSV
jgi:glycosyltransferase involved in cell wall biosynthesis